MFNGKTRRAEARAEERRAEARIANAEARMAEAQSEAIVEAAKIKSRAAQDLERQRRHFEEADRFKSIARGEGRGDAFVELLHECRKYRNCDEDALLLGLTPPTDPENLLLYFQTLELQKSFMKELERFKQSDGDWETSRAYDGDLYDKLLEKGFSAYTICSSKTTPEERKSLDAFLGPLRARKNAELQRAKDKKLTTTIIWIIAIFAFILLIVLFSMTAD